MNSGDELKGLGSSLRFVETGLPQMALSLRHFSDEFRLVKPPAIGQAVLFTLLATVARAQGRRPAYEPQQD